MKCVAEKKCQKRIGMVKDKEGKIVEKGFVQFFYPGDIFDFDKCPDGFRPLATGDEGSVEIDFKTAGEVELYEAEYDPEELLVFIKKEYPDATVNSTMGKGKLVEQLLYARGAAADNTKKAEK